jgi:outer membrane protein OmpA-like peptidoglycan-associated protein
VSGVGSPTSAGSGGGSQTAAGSGGGSQTAVGNASANPPVEALAKQPVKPPAKAKAKGAAKAPREAATGPGKVGARGKARPASSDKPGTRKPPLPGRSNDPIEGATAPGTEPPGGGEEAQGPTQSVDALHAPTESPIETTHNVPKRIPTATAPEQRIPTATGPEQRIPTATGGSYRPGDTSPPYTGAQEIEEVRERDIVHPRDGVGFRHDSHTTDVNVLETRLAALPHEIQKALRDGGRDVWVEITAGASRTGSTAYNQSLSEARGKDMADGMRALGVNAEIKVNALGETAAAKAGGRDGVDNPADRVATFQVHVEWRAPDKGGPKADAKTEPRVEITWKQKWGVADPGGEPKGKIEAKAPLMQGRFDESVSADWKAGDLSGQVKLGVWGKAESGIKASDKGVGGFVEADVTAGSQAKSQVNLGALTAGVTVFAGGKASVGAEASMSPKGISYGAKGELFLGESMGGDVGVGGDLASVKLGAEAMAGVGGKVELKGEFSSDKVGAGVKIGVALGLGGKLSFGISFSPKGIAFGVADVARVGASKLAGAVEDLLE